MPSNAELKYIHVKARQRSQASSAEPAVASLHAYAACPCRCTHEMLDVIYYLQQEFNTGCHTGSTLPGGGEALICPTSFMCTPYTPSPPRHLSRTASSSSSDESIMKGSSSGLSCRSSAYPTMRRRLGWIAGLAVSLPEASFLGLMSAVPCEV